MMRRGEEGGWKVEGKEVEAGVQGKLEARGGSW